MSTVSKDHAEQVKQAEQQLIKVASALRVKYRLSDQVKMIDLANLGVHPANRAGVFPQKDRLLALIMRILDRDGFSQETAYTQGVCVQEMPRAEQPKNYVEMHDWNIECSKRHERLEKMFIDTDRVTHGTLSRSHLLCILKIFLHQDDKWEWPDKFKPLMISSKNGLNLSAVAAIDDELPDVLSRGLKIEILSYKLAIAVTSTWR